MIVITKDLLVIDKGGVELEDTSRFVVVENDTDENLVNDDGKPTQAAITIAKNALSQLAKKEGGDSVEIIPASTCVNITDPSVRAEIEDDKVVYLDAGEIIADHDLGIFLTSANFGVDLEEIQGNAYIEYVNSLDDKGVNTSGKSFEDMKVDATIEVLKEKKIAKEESDQVVERVAKALLLGNRIDEIKQAIGV